MSERDITKEIQRIHLEIGKLLANKVSESEIIHQYKQQGLQSYYIETIIENIKNDFEDKKSFRNSMIMGVFYLIGGLLLNFLSYTIAENTNSFFFYLFLGLIVLGITTIVRGFILYKK